MTVILYLDVFFLINLLMNGLLLLLTAKILRVRPEWRRVILAAVTGACWACIVVWMQSRQGMQDAYSGGWISDLLRWGQLAGNGFLTACMTRIAFGKKRPEEFLKNLVVFWIVSIAAGGLFEAVWFVKNRSLLRFLCCAAGMYFGGRAAVIFLQERMRIQKNLYEVTLYYQGRKEQVTALLDTGNQLFEPYGHQPVHVISKEAASRLCEKVTRVIYIPYSAVGTGYGLLPGIQVDAMDVKKEGKLIRHWEFPWLAISREPLSVCHQYEMLLHGEEQ